MLERPEYTADAAPLSVVTDPLRPSATPFTVAVAVRASATAVLAAVRLSAMVLALPLAVSMESFTL